MNLRNLRFLSLVLVFGFSLAGCASPNHGRMGPWTSDNLWASCHCEGDAAKDHWLSSSTRNINYETGGDCGGKTDDHRNSFCTSKCSASGYLKGEYLMCLK